MKVNGELAQIFRDEIIEQDLTIKEVARMMNRSTSTVHEILRGGLVGAKTLKRIEKVFPKLVSV